MLLCNIINYYYLRQVFKVHYGITVVGYNTSYTLRSKSNLPTRNEKNKIKTCIE